MEHQEILLQPCVPHSHKQHIKFPKGKDSIIREEILKKQRKK
jgi:hypothetical protein